MLNQSITPPVFGDPRLPPRFWAKVRVGIFGCWVWEAYRDRKGYAWGKTDSQAGLVHRWSWACLIGPIPDGLTIDHLCRNHSCVWPAHLEPVTLRVNIQRGHAARAPLVSCKRGHRFIEGGYTVFVSLDGSSRRQCNQCAHLTQARFRKAHANDPEFRRRRSIYNKTQYARRGKR